MARSLLALVLLVVPLSATAGVPECDALAGAARTIAAGLLATEHPYDCCDETIEKCLSARPDCGLAQRLARFVCKRAALGLDAAAIKKALERRALTMVRPGQVHSFDHSAYPPVGTAGARVVLTAYLCGRCQLCSKLIPALYAEVTRGRLAGKVVLYPRLFPIKGHEGSAEAATAVAAAGSLGRFWEYLLLVYSRYDQFALDRMGQWAADAGLDRTAFDRAMADPAARQRVVDSKKEGIRNGVESTPSLFINGRKYLGDPDIETLIDFLEEEAEAP
jgi:protein-disulfide isomerase